MLYKQYHSLQVIHLMIQKTLFLEIQVACAGLAFILSIIYIVIFIVCRLRLRKRAISDNTAAVIPPRHHGLRIGQAPPLPWPTQPNPVPNQ